MINKTYLYLKNPKTNSVISCPLGFSWSVLLLGFLVPLYRKDFGNAFIIFAFSIGTFFLAQIVFAFFYNKIYIRKLFHKKHNLMYYKGNLNREFFENLKNYDIQTSAIFYNK